MSEEKKELKVDVSFVTSLKFWLAYLIVQIILMIIVFGIMFAFMAWMYQAFRGIVPQPPTTFTGFLKEILLH